MKASKLPSDKQQYLLSRRAFLGTAAAAATVTILPRHVLGGSGFQAPSDTLNIAGVGLFGMGQYNLRAVESENIVALCDIDPVRCAEIFAKYPQAKIYKDYRVMLEQQNDIDALIIATPDHTHTVITLAAMQLGKHVYTQKPLTRLVSEARALTDAAKRYNVATQMGTQGTSTELHRSTAEYVWDGAIGDVREVHIWTNRPIWPQGIPTPTDTPPVPEGLEWDLFLGPAPWRSYHPTYHPFSWRGWWDYGSGALGDIGCHSLDHPYFALKLTAPTTVEASIARPMDPEDPMDVFPRASVVHYSFPARGDMPPLKFSWYDGGLMPKRPESMDISENLSRGGGTLFVGDKGAMILESESPRLIPESANSAYQPPQKSLKRVETSHEMNWVGACKGEGPSSCPFDYAGPLTEIVVLGNLAVRFPGNVIEWDAEKMEVTNHAEANEYIKMHYREGW